LRSQVERRLRSHVERGRRPGHAFSGPRSRSTTECYRGFLIKTQPLGPTARATANGPCARTPEPPAQRHRAWRRRGPRSSAHLSSLLQGGGGVRARRPQSR